MAAGMRVDLNSDLGESFGAYTIGLDAEVVPAVSSVNVACGMHAGDPDVMLRTVRLAAGYGVAVGAHPGYPDLQGFGRRDMALTPDEVYSCVLYQVGALAAFCRAAGVPLHHVKPHGQLYNRVACDAAAAEAVARAVADFDRGVVLVGLAGSELVRAGRAAGLVCAEEFFADRGYTASGTLVRRGEQGALVADAAVAAERTVRALEQGSVESVDGCEVPVHVDTVCIHGDNARAVQFACELRAALEARGVEITPVLAD